ncbi:metallophosphoesterase family protein [Candidatus Woesearchaeota archaeon]|nr:metallophosphoesterase family protein [Candidatus Woesearchaeota archaeon]
MKIFAFADWHADMGLYKKMLQKIELSKPDVIVCAGDFTIFEQNINVVMKKISDMGECVLLIHGNHETEQVARKACEPYKNVIFLHKRFFHFNGYTFFGYGGGGFSIHDKQFEQWVGKQDWNKPKLVFIAHAPFYNTKIDYIHGHHNGNISYTEFIKKNQNIVLGICGHFHETAKKEDFISITKVVNPGPDGMLITLP